MRAFLKQSSDDLTRQMTDAFHQYKRIRGGDITETHRQRHNITNADILVVQYHYYIPQIDSKK